MKLSVGFIIQNYMLTRDALLIVKRIVVKNAHAVDTNSLKGGMSTGEKEPRPGAQTCDLCFNTEFQPHKPRSGHDFVSNRLRYGHVPPTSIPPHRSLLKARVLSGHNIGAHPETPR